MFYIIKCIPGAPIQPVIEMPQYLRCNGSVKLFWTAYNLTERVNHNYVIIIHNLTSPSPFVVLNESVVLLHLLFEQCGEFDAQVKVVNEAGESKVSEAIRFSLPLLPDTQPVSDSLSHRVWKTNSEIMVQIIFQVSILLLHCQSLVKLVQPTL